MYGLERIGKGQRADELFKKGEVMFGVINGSPKCQGAAAKEWLAEREAELLPVGYFHLVFTLPGPIADAGLPSRGNRTLAGRRGDVGVLRVTFPAEIESHCPDPGVLLRTGFSTA
jgi:hypothetical protein